MLAFNTVSYMMVFLYNLMKIISEALVHTVDQVAREEKARKERAEAEVRIKKALERASAPPFKKQGKPAMPRSTLPERAYVPAHAVQAAIDEELEIYLQRVDLL